MTEKEELCVAKLIGLLNGMDEFLPGEDMKEAIPEILFALKEKRDYDTSIEVLTQLKEKYLSSCLTCQMPCGRTNDYFLTKIENEEKKNHKLEEYEKFISTYTSSMSFMDIVYNIGRLGW